MSLSFGVGDRVRHYKYGDGIVLRSLSGGVADVKFGGYEEYVEVKDLILDPCKSDVERLLSIGSFEQAEKLYRSKCASYWKREAFDSLVIFYKKNIEDQLELERQERLRQQQETERREKIRLEKLELERQERLRQEQFEQERRSKRERLNLRLDELRTNNYLGTYDYYNSDCKVHITASEFEHANSSFVQNWIATHTHSGKSEKVSAPDDEQASAIGEVWKNTQVIARAGSGKTTTLVNRAYFLQKHCGVAPSEMLLLAFNKKAADEMAERLDKKLNGNIPHTMTFHSLAYAIVHPEESILYDDPRGNQLSLSLAFQNIINDHLREPEFEVLIREIMLAHFRGDWERIIQGGLNLSRDEMLHLR
ncbi:MAG: UvrD-helicase domain-containing protein, partial [Chlorobium sp.]